MYSNIKQTITEDNRLILEIDLNKPGRLTNTGKNLLVASSGGTVPIDNLRPEVLSLNLFKKAELPE